jgi:FMN reductase
VQASRVLIVASPTYKGAYAGLLKLFLHRIVAGALRGVAAVPLMLVLGRIVLEGTPADLAADRSTLTRPCVTRLCVQV